LSARSRFESIPRLGWIDAPTPVDSLPELAAELGLEWFGIKRDDHIPRHLGGNKIRKLDYLLGREPFTSAPTWASVGAIGSGHLVALTAAARALDRRVEMNVVDVDSESRVAELGTN
jgi:1-aminocyclopropane-1-carboxylate deaminase/D-cysteine desulfhydrase-like pyridoxal-dependent ACC family enzyme